MLLHGCGLTRHLVHLAVVHGVARLQGGICNMPLAARAASMRSAKKPKTCRRPVAMHVARLQGGQLEIHLAARAACIGIAGRDGLSAARSILESHMQGGWSNAQGRLTEAGLLTVLGSHSRIHDESKMLAWVHWQQANPFALLK